MEDFQSKEWVKKVAHPYSTHNAICSIAQHKNVKKYR